jgi:uncharacterized protein YijF (DUF1287 family)
VEVQPDRRHIASCVWTVGKRSATAGGRRQGRRASTGDWSPRATRQFGGPPPHIAKRLAAEQQRRREAIAARAAAATQQPVAPDILTLPQPRPRVVPSLVPPSRGPATSVPSVARRPLPAPATARRATPPHLRWRHVERIAASLIVLPVLAIGSLAALRPGPSVDDGVSLRLPRITLPLTAPPVHVGDIRLVALSLPDRAPTVAHDAPVARMPHRDVATPHTPHAPTGPEPRVVEPPRMSLPTLETALAPMNLARCDAEPARASRSARVYEADEPTTRLDPVAYGERLAAAARSQIGQVVVYDARYTRIAFPGGDVPGLYGVCTDVIIRAYRALGTDLQAAVQASGLGRGDTSIDHRRTETLRLYFAKRGISLPITDDAEAFLPGDIVTYYRPQNRSSTAHIAIVSSEIGPSGRPMIIHNRGNGVQEEDALFVDRITGHYRYRPAPTPQPMLMAARRPARPQVLVVRADAAAPVLSDRRAPGATKAPLLEAAAGLRVGAAR